MDRKIYSLNKKKNKRRNKTSPSADGPVLQNKTNQNRRTKRQSPLRSQPGDCPICLSFKGHMFSLGCNHQICHDCYSQIVDSTTCQKTCGLCRTEMFNSPEKQYILVNDDMKNPWQSSRDRKSKCRRSYRLVDFDEINLLRD